MKATEKKYSFTTEEKNQLTNVEIGLTSFMQAVEGMRIQKSLVLQKVLERVGEGDEQPGYERSIDYNIGQGELIIHYMKQAPAIEIANN